MGATTSMIYSGAVDATVGAFVSSAVSAITRKMPEEPDVTLYSLQQEIMKIQCAINAARRRRITDRQLLVWLASLIDAVYLGNYYLRTLTSRNSHSQMIAMEGASNLAISPSYRVAKRRRTVKTLIFGDEEIRELYRTLKILKSIDVGMFIQMVNDQPEWPIRIYLYMDHNRLFGQDKGREQVMNFLLGPSMAGKDNVDILPIVGSEGGGKTTLAFHCVYDPKVQAHFSLKLHNYFNSKFYDGGNEYHNYFGAMLKSLLNQCNITNITSDDEHTLIVMLKQSLSSERFLLILDNVVGVDSRVWNFFRDCLRCGKKGSKVILIFDFYKYDCYKKIVNPEEVEPVIVDGFSEDEYISFFEEHAFGSVDPEDFPELTKIGREMAKELGGSIWGAKIFGELLRDNLNAEFWSYFLRDCLLPSQLETCGELRKGFSAVNRVIYHLLGRRLPAGASDGGLCWETDRTAPELKSYRELMVLSPNHCTPAIEDGSNYFEVFITKKVFLNECICMINVIFL